jgi:hypothetical protein
VYFVIDGSAEDMHRSRKEEESRKGRKVMKRRTFMRQKRRENKCLSRAGDHRPDFAVVRISFNRGKY